MARDNQGLQIALIIFVMLTVVLGVTSFVFIHKCDDESRKAKEMEQTATKDQAELGQKEEECKELKRLIGLPNKQLDEIHAQFKSDMESYAGNWPEDARFYSPVLSRLVEVIKNRNASLADAKVEIEKLKMENERLEGSKDAQIATMDKEVKDSGNEVSDRTKSFDQERAGVLQEQEDLKQRVESFHKEVQRSKEKADEKVQKAEGEKDKVASANIQLKKQIDTFSRTTPDVFSGQIQGVDQHSRTVWINVGLRRRTRSADHLQRLLRRCGRSRQGREEGEHRSDPGRRRAPGGSQHPRRQRRRSDHPRRQDFHAAVGPGAAQALRPGRLP